VPSIRFEPAGVNIDVAPDVCVRDAAIQANVMVASTCGGVGSCGLCKVKVTAGAEHLSPMTPLETGKLGNVFFITKERLACQTKCAGDVTVQVPDEMKDRMARQEKNKAFGRDRAAGLGKGRR